MKIAAFWNMVEMVVDQYISGGVFSEVRVSGQGVMQLWKTSRNTERIQAKMKFQAGRKNLMQSGHC